MSTRTKKHARSWLQTIAIITLTLFASVVLLAEFIAPYDPAVQTRNLPSAPRTQIHFSDASGAFQLRPFIYRIEIVDPLEGRFAEETSQAFPLEFFVRGESYRLFGLIPSNLHLFGVSGSETNAPRVHMLGTDSLGRDRFSRLLIATKFSLIVTPIGALMAFAIGILIGLISGYANRFVDTAIMGVTDTVLALPTL